MIRYSIQQINAAGFRLTAPFEVNLGENRYLLIEEVLRILPGKRMVAKAKSQDKTILVKLFFQTRNFENEVSRYQLLCNSGIQTPALLSQQTLQEGGVCSYEFIEAAQSFGERWKAANETEKKQMLQKLLLIVKQYYHSGLCQTDLHLDNFIFSGETFYALDPASCEQLRDARGKINNLALLLAQFPLAEWPMVSAMIGAQFADVDKSVLIEQANSQQKIRTNNFLLKIYRECTYIHAWNARKKLAQQLSILCVRNQCSSGMQRLLENIEAIPEGAETLKQGNSSVVTSCVIDGKKFVIKNSRNKSIWRLLRRCLRRSRASNSWYFSHLLQDVGISVPAPVAVVERKLGPFVLESWFVSECIEGDNLLDVWLYQEPSTHELLAIKELFAVMGQLNISHGDMKATNLLVQDEKILVIDYDGMQQHNNKDAAQNALRKDRERFLKNWNTSSLSAPTQAMIKTAVVSP